MKSVALRLVLVTGAFLAFAFIEANAQIVFRVKLRWNIQDIGVTLRGLAVALPPVALLPVVAVSPHGMAQLLVTGFAEKILDPRPVRPLPAAILPSLEKPVTNSENTLVI